LKKSFVVVGQVLVIAVLMAGLLLISITTPVRAHSPGYPPYVTVVAVYGTTPTIDGTIGTFSGEWDDASTVTFTVTDGGTCTVYVKQDGSHLYVAFDIPDTTIYSSDDAGWVCLDVNHNGGDMDTDDLWFEVLRDGTTGEYYWTGIDWASRIPDGWTAACTSTSAGFQIEYSISYSKIGVIAGVPDRTLGVMFETIDYGSSTYSWPPPPSYDDYPETWADLTSPSPWFWIPEIPSSLVAIALILAAVIAYPHMRKLHT